MLATLRRDGSPRISGIEVTFADGQLWLGMMPDSRKALDLQRDPRFALHSAPLDADLKDGDAKISGRASMRHRRSHDEGVRGRREGLCESNRSRTRRAKSGSEWANSSQVAMESLGARGAGGLLRGRR